MSLDTAFDELANDIESSIDYERSGSGFMSIRCPMCKNKHQTQRKGGFKIEFDQIGYSCFRGSCDANTIYKKGEPIPRKFRALMDAIGVQIPLGLRNKKSNIRPVIEHVDERIEKNVYKNLQLPSEFSYDISDRWIEYLIDRKVIYNDFPYMEAASGPYKGSLVIPHYFYDRLIGWDYVTKTKNYVTDSKSNESMLLIPMDRMPKKPFIVEGVFDALSFPETIAVKHSNVTAKQAYHLRNTSPIVIPDRTGSKLYESAKYYGWDVCIPPWKEKDINKAIQNKGIMVVAKMIHERTMKAGNRSDILYKKWVMNNDR